MVCLLSCGRYLTAAQIREAVPGYPDSFEAFKRMFERDKDELRELGIPLETGIELGRWTRRPATASRGRPTSCPRSRLEPDEAAVLGAGRAGLAPRRAGRSGCGRAAQAARRRDRRRGDDPAGDRAAAADAGEAAFGPLWEAVRDRRPVTFGYRAAGRSEPQQRRGLEPWGVVNRHGRWYVVGQDTDRGAERVFRLSRIDGPVTFTGPAGSVTVPPGTDVRAAVRDWDAEPPRAAGPASCAVRSGAGYGLRRHAVSVEPDPAPGWDLVEAPFSDSGWSSEHLASFGADVVVVLEPADLRDAVIGRLKGVLA